MESTAKLSTPPIKYHKMRRMAIDFAGKTLIYLAMILMCLAFLAPFIWTLSASLKTQSKIFSFPPKWIPEQPWQWQNYSEGLTIMKFPLRLRNSILYSTSATFGTLVSSSLVAFGFARCHFKGRNLLFRILLSTMMLPSLVVLIPTFLIFFRLGWTDSYTPLILPTFFGNAFNIFLLRQFFLTLPTELDDAARIDGCSPLGIWWYITLPLSKSALATVTILSLMGTWGDFLGPVVYLSNADLYPLSLGLFSLTGGALTPHWEHIMACAVVISLPPLALFLFGQRYILQSAVMSGLKG
jgi:multiple sugar transport system permease protein